VAAPAHAAPAGRERTTHRVQAGDTLWSISRRFGVGVDDVARWNGIANPTRYKLLAVKPDRLELKERLYFEWDQAVLMDVSFPVLDEVVQALKDNTDFRVMIEGHASSEGGYDHNMSLSEKLAEAVLAYLASHGIAPERLASKGFSSSVPAASNVTEAGREANRRVEFIVHFAILADRS